MPAAQDFPASGQALVVLIPQRHARLNITRTGTACFPGRSGPTKVPVKGAAIDRLLRNMGRRVGELRRVRQLTQEQLAERLGLSPRYVQQIESGDANPSIRALCEVAGQLHADFQDLLTQPTSEKPRPGRPRNKRRPT